MKRKEKIRGRVKINYKERKMKKINKEHHELKDKGNKEQKNNIRKIWKKENQKIEKKIEADIKEKESNVTGL